MKRILKSGAAGLVLAAALAGYSAAQDATLGAWGIETQHISSTVDPGDDFFRYVNEGWLESAGMPAGFPANGAFLELHLLSESRVADIIADMSSVADAAQGSPEQQVRDLHASYMDTAAIEAAGLDPIRADVDAFLALDDRDAIAAAFARSFAPSFVSFYINLDPNNPDAYRLNLTQSGLGLPGRDYYLRDDEEFQGYQDAYRAYIARIFELAGYDDGAARADRIYALEAAMAEVHWEPADAQDSVLTNNPTDRDGLEALAPGFNWDVFFEASGVGHIEDLNVDETTAITAMAALFAETPVETWNDYLAFHYIDNHTTYLPAAFDEASFAFYSQTLNGVPEQRARDLRAIQQVNNNLGEQVGRIYVERHFPESHKTQMEELVNYLRRALAERIETLDWMDTETREQAQRKLASFNVKIGYPDVWRDFSDLEVRPDDLIGNMHRIQDWYWNDSRSRLGGPVRDWEWGMSPQTVNAYYSSTRNEIVFPAAILQAPFFDPEADAAVNFGAIGGVIGHEIGHGFDDDGSRFDADGYLRNWWTDTSRAGFEERTSALISQYDGFSPLEGINVNGELTLGENIGDLGGLSMALHAYRLYAADNGETGRVIDGYTPEQRFFLSWGQVWRTLMTDGYMRNLVLTDEHSPAQYRVNGIVRNMDDWYEAFDVDETDDLYLPPEERIDIW